MDLTQAPLRRRSAVRANALRLTRAQKAIAAVMNGVDPDPDDVAYTAGHRIDEQMLHLSAAAALRQVLLSRPSRTRRATESDQQVVLDAYYLALALADAAAGHPDTLNAAVARPWREWFAAAALVARLQTRFLEHACSQIEMTAKDAPAPAPLAGVLASDLLSSTGMLGCRTALLPDYATREDSRRTTGMRWLRATSTVTVAGHPATVVVDAGPDALPGAWTARIAAPLEITAGVGDTRSPTRWPREVVTDCLRMCSSGVRSWVASMTRRLSGEAGEELVLQPGAAPGKFLVSPAAAAIAELVGGQRSEEVAATGPFEALAAGELPLAPDTSIRPVEAPPGMLARMRHGGDPGDELSADTRLEDYVTLPNVHRDEITLLAAAEPFDVGTEVEVTINFATPPWQDVSALAAELRSAGGATLTAPTLGRIDQDVVPGEGHRLALKARVRRGVAVRTRRGYAVMLPAGTRLAVIGSDVTKHHTTLYAVCAPEPAEPAALAVLGGDAVGNVA